MGKIFMKQGEIWLINLDPSVGAEMQKTRPALIVNADTLGRLPLRIVAPITGWKEHFLNNPWMVRIDPSSQNGLTKVSTVDCFQIRSVSISRIVSKVGVAGPEIIARVQEAISRVIASA
jgi:mRNA interferase MazF